MFVNFTTEWCVIQTLLWKAGGSTIPSCCAVSFSQNKQGSNLVSEWLGPLMAGCPLARSFDHQPLQSCELDKLRKN